MKAFKCDACDTLVEGMPAYALGVALGKGRKLRLRIAVKPFSDLGRQPELCDNCFLEALEGALQAWRDRAGGRTRRIIMATCLLCNEHEGEMEFNTPTSQGMLIADICFECWAEFPSDTDVALAIARKRREAAIDLFDLPHDILTHWSDVPEEKRPAIRRYLLQGAG